MVNNGLSAQQKIILKDVLRPFANKIDSVAIFGSRATGMYRDDSDIDMVIYGALSEQDVDRLWTLFDASPLALKVDVNGYNLVSYPALKAHIDMVATQLFNKQDLLAPNCKGQAKC